MSAKTHVARLDPSEPSWLDLALETPLIDSSRIRADSVGPFAASWGMPIGAACGTSSIAALTSMRRRPSSRHSFGSGCRGARSPAGWSVGADAADLRALPNGLGCGYQKSFVSVSGARFGDTFDRIGC